MLYFPQLSTGALGQCPLTRRRRSRTIKNEAPDGSSTSLADAGAATVEWELNLAGLTTAELEAVESLFKATEGRLATFTFLDPAENLFSWSEDLTQTAWLAAPMLAISGGRPDPAGTNKAFRIVNTGQAAQRITQAVAGPAWYMYCLSVYARADQAGEITLVRSSATSAATEAFAIGTNWKRLYSAGRLQSQEDGVVCGFEIGAGCTLEVFGPQLAAQPGPGGYRRTGAWSGVYPESRFASDTLRVVTDGANRHSSGIGIISRPAGC